MDITWFLLCYFYLYWKLFIVLADLSMLYLIKVCSCISHPFGSLWSFLQNALIVNFTGLVILHSWLLFALRPIIIGDESWWSFVKLYLTSPVILIFWSLYGSYDIFLLLFLFDKEWRLNLYFFIWQILMFKVSWPLNIMIRLSFTLRRINNIIMLMFRIGRFMKFVNHNNKIIYI